jgi:hypothetical protein
MLPTMPNRRRRPFPPQRDFASLSVRDLLDAREAYHVHLSTLGNVVGTAIGRYRIQEGDWYEDHPPDEPEPADYARPRTPRTLANSVVRPWSWPAVLVFVREWRSREELGSQVVPDRLYLPDGRVAPTCVILAPPDESLPEPVANVGQGSEMIGGGFLCLRQAQGVPHVGTLACMVRRHGTLYALTSKHVAGAAGDEVLARMRGTLKRIGVAAPLELTRKTMASIFPGWPGERTYVRLDAGLVLLEDVSFWTSQVFGIGEVGEVFDATPQTVTLDLIGTPVRAFGGASGVVEGEIQGLFYRYQSLGSFDYVGDVLIGPRADPASVVTRPGDSGALWFYDPPHELRPGEREDDPISPPTLPERGARARRLRPIAMQWGAVRTRLPDGRKSPFALASFLSTVCGELDVEVERSWSTGHDEYWGKIGHFAIGWKACDLVDGKLGTLMQANQPNIGFGNDRLGEGREFRMGRGAFVPLADVPDYVWIGRRQSTEPVQHFADIDIHDIHGGPSMLEACRDDPRNLSARVWRDYFDGFEAEGCGPQEGLLPFRVWQIFEEMVRFLAAREVEPFVAAAGILAHYLGDASQPLHCSYLHHGRLPLLTVHGRRYPVPHDRTEGSAYDVFSRTREAKIHAIYEQGMLETDALAALIDVDAELAAAAPAVQARSGYEAALRTFELMSNAHARLSPEDIIDADEPGLTQRERGEHLWANARIRRETVRSLADSTRLLAGLWRAAWAAGDGDSLPEARLGRIDEAALEAIYRPTSFLRSLTLDAMVQSGRFEPPGGG